MNIISILSMGFIVLMVLVAFWGRKKDQEAEDFQNMSQSGNWLLIAGTYSATVVSAVGMVGLPGMSYSQGFLVGLLSWGSTLAYIVSALFFGPRIRKFGAVTFGEFFEARFNSRNMRFLTSIVIVFGVGAYFISQTIGSAVVLEQMLQIPYNYTVVLSVIVIVIISLIGGARSVTIMDTIMFVIIGLGLGLIFAPNIIKTVGLERIQALSIAKPDYFNWNGVTKVKFGTIIGWITLWALGFAASPVNLTRAFIAKNNREWIKGLLVGFAVTVTLIWTMHASASFVYAINPDLPVASTALPWAAMNVVSPIVGLVATLGLTAACISTADTQILVVSQSIVNDFLGYFNRNMNEEKAVKLVKAMIIIVGLIGLVLSLGKPNFVVLFGNFGSSVFAAAFFPVVLFGLYCDWVTKEAASVSILSGIIADFALHAYPAIALGKVFGYTGYLPYSIHPVIWSTIISILVLLIVSRITKPSTQLVEEFEAAITVDTDKSGSSDATMIKWGIGVMVYGVIGFLIILSFAMIV